MKEGTALPTLQKYKRLQWNIFQQLYAKKLDKLNEMEKLLGKHKLPKLTQEEK